MLNSTSTARHEYQRDMETRGASVATGWASGGHIEVNGAQAGISTLSDGNGTGMASGASIEAAGASASGATWSAAAVGMTSVDAHTEYESVNAGASSAQYSRGESDVQTSTVAYSDMGSAVAGAHDLTAGDTRMVNDGVGGAMATSAKSHSEVNTSTGTAGVGYSTAHARAANTHYGTQVAFGAGTYQYQETMVSTGAAE